VSTAGDWLRMVLQEVSHLVLLVHHVVRPGRAPPLFSSGNDSVKIFLIVPRFPGIRRKHGNRNGPDNFGNFRQRNRRESRGMMSLESGLLDVLSRRLSRARFWSYSIVTQLATRFHASPKARFQNRACSRSPSPISKRALSSATRPATSRRMKRPILFRDTARPLSLSWDLINR